jgi:hypothetical protein
MECAPRVSVEVLNVAAPPDKLLVPRVVAPSLNVTVPVAVDGVTVAVKVTGLPYADGLADAVTAVVVVERPTLKVPVAELDRKILCVGYVAEPLVSGLTNATPLSTLNDTLPVGVPVTPE